MTLNSLWLYLAACSLLSVVVDCVVLRYTVVEELGPGPTVVGDVLSTLKRENFTLAAGTTAAGGDTRVQFALLPGKHQQLFTVDETTGLLKTRGPLDRDALCVETPGSCKLDVEVAIIRPVDSFHAFHVEIIVDDINDNPPKFEQESYTIHVLESSVPERSVYPLPVARDADSGLFAVDKYTLKPNDTFALRQSTSGDGLTTASLVLRRNLDREVQSTYQLVLTAYDGGKPRLSGSLTINVVVVDVNDNSPAFDRQTYNVTVLETVDPVRALVRVRATDPDEGANGRVAYKLGGVTTKLYGTLFAVDNTTGDVYLTRRLEADYREMYGVAVLACDQGAEPRTSTTRVTVNVQDVNGHPPTINVNALGRSRRAEVRENQPAGTFVAYVSTDDADRGLNGDVVCTVASANFSVQLVHTKLYKLTTSIVFDREQVDRYIAVIRCTDLGTPALATTDWAEVVVLDDNDHSPRFGRRLYDVSVSENSPVGRSVFTLTATDDDTGLNALVEFSVGDETSAINVDSATGLVTLNAVFDYELTTQLEFDVVARDKGSPARSSTATLRIKILNENDCSPTFTQTAFSFGVFENLTPQTEVGTVSAIDGDWAPFNDFYYLLKTPLSETTNFAIDQMTGRITTTRELDREVTSIYYLTALAIDSHNTSFMSSASVTVYVADKNDNKPIITFPSSDNYTVQVSSYSPVGFTATKIQASDADIGSNAALIYEIAMASLVGEVDNIPFDVDINNGAIYVTNTLRQTRIRDYVLSVTVRDSGSPPMSASASLVIHVNDSLAFAVAQSFFHSTNGGGEFGFNQQILVILAAVTSIVVMLLVAAIVFVRRRQLKARRRSVARLPANTVATISCDEQQQQQQQQVLQQQLMQELMPHKLTPVESCACCSSISQGQQLLRVNQLHCQHCQHLPSFCESVDCGYLPEHSNHPVTCSSCVDNQMPHNMLLGAADVDSLSASTEDFSNTDSGRGLSEDSTTEYYGRLPLPLVTFLPKSAAQQQLQLHQQLQSARLSTPPVQHRRVTSLPREILAPNFTSAAAGAATEDRSTAASYGKNLSRFAENADKTISDKNWRRVSLDGIGYRTVRSSSVDLETTRQQQQQQQQSQQWSPSTTVKKANLQTRQPTSETYNHLQQQHSSPTRQHKNTNIDRTVNSSNLSGTKPNDSSRRLPPLPPKHVPAHTTAAKIPSTRRPLPPIQLSPVASSTDADNVSEGDDSMSTDSFFVSRNAPCVSDV